MAADLAVLGSGMWLLCACWDRAQVPDTCTRAWKQRHQGGAENLRPGRPRGTRGTYLMLDTSLGIRALSNWTYPIIDGSNLIGAAEFPLCALHVRACVRA